MNFTFIPSPEKAKKFTAVEDENERTSPYRLENGAWPHFRRLCVSSMNPDLVNYYTNKYKCFIDYEFVSLEK